MGQELRFVDGLAGDYLADAADLVFEYMATTLGESGRPVPRHVSQLPAVLRRECENLPASYAAPGKLFIAYQGDAPVGCVGLSPGPPPGSMEVKRLFVRPGARSSGLGRLLMWHAHEHVASRHFQRSVLDVMPARGRVIGFYRRLGYAECEPFATDSPDLMIFMQRPAAAG